MGRDEGRRMPISCPQSCTVSFLGMKADADRAERFPRYIVKRPLVTGPLSSGSKIFANEHTYCGLYGFVGIRKFGRVFEPGHYLHRPSRTGLSSIRMRACTHHLRTHTQARNIHTHTRVRRSNIRACESRALREGNTRMQILMIGPQWTRNT